MICVGTRDVEEAENARDRMQRYSESTHKVQIRSTPATMLSCSEVEIELGLDRHAVAYQLCGSVKSVEEMEACRSPCDENIREFADAVFQLLSSGALGAAFLVFEPQLMSASQACVRAVLNAGTE